MTAENKPQDAFETHLQALEDSVRKLESGDTPLEDAVREFERGMDHVKQCEALLNAAQLRVEQLLQATPDAALTPLDEDSPAAES